MEPLDRIPPTLKTGNEPLTFNAQPLTFSLLDFWKWSVSDILSNATRGIFAEFIVATAVGVDIKEVRDEWGNYDLTTREGIKLEIKSCAYVQSWFQKTFSKISFSTKLSRPWDNETNLRELEARRSADVYIFCLLHHKDKKTVDPLDMDQWEFYVLSTSELNNYQRSQHSITLPSLQKLAKAVKYDGIYEAVKKQSQNNNASFL